MKPLITGLRTSQINTPIGLEDRRPSFSWQLHLAGRQQGGYRILVRRLTNALSCPGEIVWDSGRVGSSECTGIIYAGEPLVSRQAYSWEVELWDERGEPIGRSVSGWETGIFDETEWLAGWLAAEDEAERADREVQPVFVGAPRPDQGGTRTFRLNFHLERAARCRLVLAVSAARLHACRINDDALEMAWRHPNAWGEEPALVQSLKLQSGHHVLYAELKGVDGLFGQAWVALAGMLRIEREDGCVERIAGPWILESAREDDGRASGEQSGAGRPAAPLRQQPNMPWPPSAASCMRRSFMIDREVLSARLYVTAFGSYLPRINGHRVGDDRLASESTDFLKRVYYRVHDATALLREGENVLSLTVGDGWYASYQAPGNRYPFASAPRCVRAQLEIEFRDGTRRHVATDTEWRVAPSAILSSEIYNGEVFDARLDQPGWDQPGFDASSWSKAHPAVPPPAKLACLTSPPIRTTRHLKPVSVTEPLPGIFVADFGQNFAGVVRMEVNAPQGHEVKIRFGEIIQPNGLVDQSNLRGAAAVDTYISSGPGKAHWEPQFTYHGFRYAEIEGLPAAPTSDEIDGVVIHSDLAETGEFSTGSRMVNQIWQNALWSQRSNFVGIPTDCPQRDERLGWTGDARVFWDAAAFNMDVYAFTRRFMNDLRDAQRADNGSFPVWAPMIPTVEQNPVTSTPTPGWADCGVTLPWICALRYGDMTIVDENWDAMRKFVSGILNQNPDYIWRKGRGLDFGDWLSVDAATADEETTPKELIASALLIQCLDHMSDMAGWSGREIEAASFRRTANEARRLFSRWISPDGTVGNGSHTSYALAIALDLVPTRLTEAAGRRFRSAIRDRGTMLTCGFIGTPLALDAIAKTGDHELIYDLLLRTDYPSWGYMVDRGATTVWERWNSDTGNVAMNSFNHYALGAVAGFLYRRIAGIDAAAPGFSRIRMAPICDPRLAHARASYSSVRGRITSEWRLDGDKLTYDVSVPSACRAEIQIPALPAQSVICNERELSSVPGLRVLGRSDRVIVAEAEGGRFGFSVS